MPLADATTIAEQTDLSSAFAVRAAKYALSAENYCRSVLGAVDLEAFPDAGEDDDQYDAIAALASSSPVDARYQKLVRAESLVAAALGLKPANLRATEAGGFVRSTGFDASKQVFMSQRELSAYKREFMHEADGLLRSVQGYREPLYSV